MVAVVASTAGGGSLRRRAARFIPIGGAPDDTVGLIALVDTHDLEEPEPGVPSRSPAEAEDVWLHEQIRIFQHQAAARGRLDRLVGESPAIRRVRAQVALAAESEANVLIVGPAGSGRQLVAEAIHYGERAESSGSLIPLACSVLGADLIRSTVAALASREPSAGEGGRGTLLLNVADQLPMEVQAEMARALSARLFPLRSIATASESLVEMARGGQYRDDLASLLSTVVIELPPLRERRGDLAMLAQLFLEEVNSRSDKQVAGFSSEALDRLDGYSWPGNLDELARLVAEAHDRAETPQITAGELPDRIRLAADAGARPSLPEETIELDELLGRIERELIRRAMSRAKGNKARAARLLGMTRPRLYRRLVQLGLEDPATTDDESVAETRKRSDSQ
jgi:DNA-binding NtrC family response regulator